MSEQVRERRAAKKKADGTLFDTQPVTRPAKTPGWVIRELVDRWGLQESTARGFAPNVAFAVLYKHREGRVLTQERRDQIRNDLAQKMREARHNTAEWDHKELSDVTAEAIQFLDRETLARVVLGIANLIDPPKSST